MTTMQRSSAGWGQLSEALLASVGICRITLSEECPELARRLQTAGASVDLLNSRSADWGDAAVLFLNMDSNSNPADCSPLTHYLPAGSVFVIAEANGNSTDGIVSRERIEQRMLEQGLRKHPATTRLFGFEGLGKTGSELWALFEKIPDSGIPGERDRLLAERDLHADMLREAGVRSDAHIVRYQLAADVVRPGDTVLDAACGLGYGSHVLTTLCSASRIIGVDESEWAIEYARRNYSSSRTTFDLGKLPEALAHFGDASIDCIVSLETIEHVENPGAVFDEFLRILKPGGRIVVSVPNDWADETGRDPSPYHLHVYNWARLSSELGQRFCVERAWRLIASGCKTGMERKWVSLPRLLRQVNADEASGLDSEWWVATAMKSPVAAESVPYRQTVHGNFHGKTHLVDFETHYDNPWLVQSLVEIPWRMQDHRQLVTLAAEVYKRAHAGSADTGAALAVQGWRLYEEGPTEEAVDRWIVELAKFRKAAKVKNPHVQRWLVSLGYLEARLYEQKGLSAKAEHAYKQMIEIDILRITPTLGTKSVDASLRLGILQWVDGREIEGRETWRKGIASAEACLKSDWTEFLGDIDHPFAFSLNDAIETLDLSVRCALALRATGAGWPRQRVAVELGELRSRSLRSANQLLARQLAERERDMQQTNLALAEAQGLALGRADELRIISGQLACTQTALDTTQQLAVERARELTAISSQLRTTQDALDQTQILAHTRASEIQALSERMDRTQAALDQTQILARTRALDIRTISERTERTQAALEKVQKLALERANEISELYGRLTTMQEGLKHAEGLLQLRSAENDAIRRDLTLVQAEAQSWKSVYDGMVRSTSWRITAPLRKIAQILRRS